MQSWKQFVYETRPPCNRKRPVFYGLQLSALTAVITNGPEIRALRTLKMFWVQIDVTRPATVLPSVECKVAEEHGKIRKSLKQGRATFSVGGPDMRK